MNKKIISIFCLVLTSTISYSMHHSANTILPKNKSASSSKSYKKRHRLLYSLRRALFKRPYSMPITSSHATYDNNGSDHNYSEYNSPDFKIIQPHNSEILLDDKTKIIRGMEALNLNEIDIFTGESFKEILSERPLSLAVATTAYFIEQENQRIIKQHREYYCLEELRTWTQQENAFIYVDPHNNIIKNRLGESYTSMSRFRMIFNLTEAGWSKDAISELKLKLVSPLSRQIIEHVKVFSIKNLQANAIKQEVSLIISR